MATLLKVLNNLTDIKSVGGVALRVRTQGVVVEGDGLAQARINPSEYGEHAARIAPRAGPSHGPSG